MCRLEDGYGQDIRLGRCLFAWHVLSKLFACFVRHSRGHEFSSLDRTSDPSVQNSSTAVVLVVFHAGPAAISKSFSMDGAFLDKGSCQIMSAKGEKRRRKTKRIKRTQGLCPCCFWLNEQRTSHSPCLIAGNRGLGPRHCAIVYQEKKEKKKKKGKASNSEEARPKKRKIDDNDF